MYDFVVDGLGKNVIVEENEGELEMKKYELSAFVKQGLWFFDEEHCFKDACNQKKEKKERKQ